MQKKIRQGIYHRKSKLFLARIGNHIEDLTKYIDDDTKALFELQSLLIEHPWELHYSFTGLYETTQIDLESIH